MTKTHAAFRIEGAKEFNCKDPILGKLDSRASAYDKALHMIHFIVCGMRCVPSAIIHAACRSVLFPFLSLVKRLGLLESEVHEG